MEDHKGPSYHNRLDFKSGYHQICIVLEAIHKTKFGTQSGLYENVVIPFNLTNDLATFCKLKNKMSHKQCDLMGVVFDDVITHFQTKKEHLKAIFLDLRANRIFINDNNGDFSMQEIKSLGLLFLNMVSPHRCR